MPVLNRRPAGKHRCSVDRRLTSLEGGNRGNSPGWLIWSGGYGNLNKLSVPGFARLAIKAPGLTAWMVIFHFCLTIFHGCFVIIASFSYLHLKQYPD